MTRGKDGELTRLTRSDAESSCRWVSRGSPQAYSPTVHSHPDFNRVFESPREKPDYLVSRGCSAVEIRNAICQSGSNLILRGSRATFVGLNRETESFLASYDLDKLESISKRHIWLRNFESPPPTFEFTEAIVLFGSYMNQWGHCFQDLVYRVLAIGVNLKDIPILVQSDSPTNFLELLEGLFGFQKVVLVPKASSVKVKRAIVPLPRTSCPVGWSVSENIYQKGSGWIIDPVGTLQLQTMAANRYGLVRKPSKKIYLRRSESRFRRVWNERNLYRELVARGFESVEMEDLSMRESLSLLEQADVVVGVSGSQFLSLLLAPPGIKCIVITSQAQSPYILPQGLLAAGHQVRLVRARTVASESLSPYGLAQGDLWVSVNEVVQMLAEST